MIDDPDRRLPATWSVHLDVREDAASMFVPFELLPGAVAGDVVIVSTSSRPDGRRGHVVVLLDDDSRGRFFTVSFEDESAALQATYERAGQVLDQ